MKTRSVVSLASALLGFASVGADLSVANTYTYDNPYRLTANTECDELRLAAGAVLDLNGYNLIVKAGSWSDAALITNSVDGTTAHISMTPTDNNGWGAQFQGNLKFGGNLELTVCGIVNNGRSWGRRGFQNAHNTHTGGTVLDGYATNYVNEAEGNLPMWNSADAFGTGPLTLKNGAIIKTDANDLNPAFSKLIVDGDGAATNMLYCTNQRFDLQKPVEVAAGNTLHIKYKGRYTYQRFMTGDLTGVKGRIIFQAIEDNCQFNIFAGAEYGTLTLAGTVADAEDSSKDYYTEIRFNGSSSITLDDPIKIGMIESAADVTAADAKMGFRANFGSNTGFKNLQIGGSGLSGTYYGSIIRHSNGSDWNVEKAGAGTWTLGGNTHSEVYRGTTTLSGGMLKMADAGRLGAGNLIFNGGTLGFAASSTNTIGSAIVATDHPITVDADEGACGVLSGSTTGATAGLVKTGAGMVRLTGTKLVQNEGTSGKLMIASGNTGIGEVKTWEGGLGVDELMLDDGQTLDLDGRDLMVRKVSQSMTAYGGSIVKNDSDKLATFTVGVGNGATANKMFAFQGNVRYVVTGSDGTHFRSSDDKGADGETVVPNTHTGGTVISNATSEIRFYSASANFGTGPIVFSHGGRLFMPSNLLIDDYGTIANAIEVYGTGNVLRMEGYSWGPGFNFNGAFSGDGELYISNGWQPFFYFNSNANDDFTGTLILGYKRNEERGFYIGEDGNGFKNATVCLTNIVVSGNDTDVRATHLTCQQKGDDVYFGHLITGDLEGFTHEKTKVIANHSGTTTLHIGAKGLSGTFSGSFVEQSGKAFAIVKEGAGTWTLDGTVASTVSGGVTVSAGTLTVNTTISEGAVSVASGATLAGSGTIPSVSFESGAILSTTNLTVTGESNFRTAPYVYLDPDVLEAGKTYTILTSTSMPGNALLREDLTNQIAGVYLTQANNTLTLTVPENVVAPGRTADNVYASSEEAALAAVAIRLTDDDIDAGRKTSYYKKVATETEANSGVWSVAVKLADEVEVEIGTETTPSVTASKVTFSPPTNLKKGLYYGVASGTSVGSLACTQNARYDGDGTTPPTLSADMPHSGVMYYSIEVSDTAKSSN